MPVLTVLVLFLLGHQIFLIRIVSLGLQGLPLLRMMTWREAVGEQIPGPLAIGSWEWVQKPDNTGLVIGGDLGNTSKYCSSGCSLHGIAADIAEKLLQENHEADPRLNQLERIAKCKNGGNASVRGQERNKIGTSQKQRVVEFGGLCGDGLSKSAIYDDISLALVEVLNVARAGQKSRLETIYTSSSIH